MSAGPGNKFVFKHSRHLSKVTALRAVMRDFQYEKHAHEEIALGVTLAGRQDFVCKGTGFKSRPGNIILFNPEDVHDGCPGNRTTLKYAMLYIHPDQLDPLMHSLDPRKRRDRRMPDTLFDDPPLRSLILSFVRLLADENGTGLEEEWHLYEIANRLSQRLGSFRPMDRVQAKDPLLLRAREYIHDNLDRELSLDELCGVAHVSKYHFIRLFRRQFGITPHKYLLSCRVNQARRELENGMTPSDAAQMAGFADLSHLNRNFKRIYGTTPKRYQRNRP